MDWSTASCRPLNPPHPLLSQDAIDAELENLSGWTAENGKLVCEHILGNYLEVLAFVNAVGWLAHQEDHHPVLSFGFKQVRIVYTTHSLGGISENDLICAAKINRLRL